MSCEPNKAFITIFVMSLDVIFKSSSRSVDANNTMWLELLAAYLPRFMRND